MPATFGPGSNFERSPWRLVLWAIPTALLISPAVAMQFTERMEWGPFDFLLGAALLYGTAGLIDVALRKCGSVAYGFGAGLALLNATLLIVINGAVGMIGDESNPLNLLFFGVIAVAAVGAVIAGFRPRGMARAMLAAAGAHAGVTLMVPIFGWAAGDPPGLIALTFLIGVFAVPWCLAAALFARAARAGSIS